MHKRKLKAYEKAVLAYWEILSRITIKSIEWDEYYSLIRGATRLELYAPREILFIVEDLETAFITFNRAETMEESIKWQEKCTTLLTKLVNTMRVDIGIAPVEDLYNIID